LSNGTARRTALVLCGLALASSCRRAAPPAQPPRSVAVEVTGEVFRGDAGVPSTERTLSVGETLATGPDGHAVIRLPGGRQLELSPNARLRLREGAGGTMVVEVENGRVVSRTPAEAGVTLDILTPFGITRVPSGRGEAVIAVGSGGTRIDVALGAVIFLDRDGKAVTAREHESLEVTMGRVQLLRPGESSTPENPAAVDVMLSAEQGPLLVRGPGEARFTPRRALPAAAGTSFKVAAAGRARIVATGLRARLGPGVTGVIGEATHDEKGLHAEVTLATGESIFIFDGTPAELVLPGPRGPLVVRVSAPTTLTVVAGPRGPRLGVLNGAAELVMGKAHQRLDAGLLAQVNGERLAVAPRPRADVILPATRGLRVYADALSEVTLSWPATLTRGTVEVATDPEFKDLVLSGKASGSSVTVPAPARGELYWRVTTDQRTVEGQARFAPDRRHSVLDLERPHNLVTEAGPVTTVYFQSTLPALTFTFNARPGALRYRLRVYRDEDLERPMVDRMVTGTRSAVDAALFAEGRYVWNALPVDRNGRELGGGRMNKLELVYDNVLTTLAIGTPKPGQPVSGPEVDAAGVAPLGTKLYINGKPAPLDDKGRFALRVGRTPAVVFRLIGPDGAERYWIRKLRVGS
jgi:hypothetical protein